MRQAATAETERLEELFSAFTPDRPGLAVLVAREGAVLCERYLGAADLEHAAPVHAETRFHVASVSKQFTAFAVLQLATRGKLDLGADIRGHLPELADYGAKVSIADLVHHTGGLRDQWDLMMLSGTPLTGVIRQEAILAMAARQRALNFEPGTEFRYSNTGYSLLAEIVARVSGVPFRRYLQDEVFAPLGMDRTVVYDNASDVLPDRAMSYRLDRDGSARQVRLNYSNYGATSLQSTPRDLMKWSAEILRPTVFDPDLIRAFLTPGRLLDGRPLNYAFGIMRDAVGGLPAYSHGGADAGYRAYFASFAGQDAGIVVLSNGQADVAGIGAALAEIFLGAAPAMAGVPDAPDRSLPERLAGYYLSDWGAGLTLEAKDGKLVGTVAGRAIGDARFLPDGGFYFGSPASAYLPQADGSLAERQPTGGIDLAHRRAARAAPTADDLRALEGDYRSDELDVTYRLSAEAAGLVLSSLRNAPVRLEPADADGFDGDALRLRLVRAADGPVTGFEIATGRVRGLRFERVSGD